MADESTNSSAPRSLTFTNVFAAHPTQLGPAGSEVASSIAKLPTGSAELALTTLNIEGDDQADRNVHGGVDKAVCVYPSEHMQAWADELGQPELLEAGDASRFGENLLTTGATEASTFIGDTWTWGSATLQVSQPRRPCRKLALYRGSADIRELMKESGRTGWYLRVLTPGVIPTSGTIDVEPHPARVSVLDAHRAMFDRDLADRGLVERVAELGEVLEDQWRLSLQQRLEKHG